MPRELYLIIPIALAIWAGLLMWRVLRESRNDLP